MYYFFIDKIRNFLTEFYSDSDSGKGKHFKYGSQLVRCTNMETALLSVYIGQFCQEL